MARYFDDFIQARKTGRGQQPEWHIVRHLLRVRDICRQILRLEICHHDVALAMDSGSTVMLGLQAARMYGGHFDELLALPSVHERPPSAAPALIYLPGRAPAAPQAAGQQVQIEGGNGLAQPTKLPSSEQRASAESGSILPGSQQAGQAAGLQHGHAGASRPPDHQIPASPGVHHQASPSP